jgi:hypothetical protein
VKSDRVKSKLLKSAYDTSVIALVLGGMNGYRLIAMLAGALEEIRLTVQI